MTVLQTAAVVIALAGLLVAFVGSIQVTVAICRRGVLRAVTHFVLVLSFPAAFVLAWDWHQAPLEGSLVVLGTAALSMALMSFAPKLRSFYGLEWRDYAVNQAGVAVVFAGALLAALTRR